MIKKLTLILISFFLNIGSAVFPQDLSEINIPYKKFVLNNGLTLIVHEDHKAPIAAVSVWYHVGSKNEKHGKTGFAHLFEHLMYNGSEHFNDDYFQAMERIGATDMNGTTNKDRTNYFENVPTSGLDVALWMESDRMGYLLGAIDSAKLNEQRGVVQNEKRQGENQPYGRKIRWAISQNTYPYDHPYSWETIGYMEDLDSASLDDVKNWFNSFYGAANAVIVISGDVNTNDVKQKVEKYFGDIPAGPPIERQKIWINKMSGSKRVIMEDRVPQARIYKVWNVPQWNSQELAYLDLVSDVLALGKTSRLFKRLVYEDQIATDVSAYYDPGEIGSQFVIYATAKPDGDLAQVENAIEEELNKFLKEGPTKEEVEKVKTHHIANFIRGIEQIGGFRGKSNILAQGEVFADDPGFYKTKLRWVKNATVENLKNAAVKWLLDGVFNLEVHPYPNYSTAVSEVNRAKLPEAGTPPEAKFPEIQEAALSNGLKILFAKRSSIPIINFNLLIDAGYSADQFSFAGTANLTSSMLDEGTDSKNALQISDELLKLGANLSSSANLDFSIVSFSALKSNLDKSLDLFADVILNPSFPEQELKRVKKETLARIAREKVNPVSMAIRVLPRFLFGKDHAYGNPMTGTGFKETVEKITRKDLSDFHNTWFKPNNATLVIVGDADLNSLKPKLEKLFADWKKGKVPQKNISKVENKKNNIIYLLDKPGAEQSVIFGAEVVPPISEINNIAVETLNNILGGTFTSRINMNLREDKHWSYGAHSFIRGTKVQRPFVAYGLVQTDKTKESLIELRKELIQIIGKKPPVQEELNKVKLNQTLELSGSWETSGDIASAIDRLVMYNLPKNYYKTYADKVKNLSLDEINKIAKEIIHPDDLVWIVVGDKSKIEKGLTELNYEIKMIDSDGDLIN